MVSESTNLVGTEGDTLTQKQAVSPDDGEGSTKDPFLFADSLIKGGKCKAVACSVGENSSRGRHEKKLNTSVNTPLQDKLDNLSD